MSMAALGIQALKKLTRPVKRAISSLFSGRRVCTDCFGMFVIGLQARTGDVKAEEVEVLLVEPAEDLPQVLAVLALVNRADQNVI